MLGSLVPSRDLNLEFWSHPLMFGPYLLHLLFMRRLLSQLHSLNEDSEMLLKALDHCGCTDSKMSTRVTNTDQTQQEFCNEHTQMVFTQ